MNVFPITAYIKSTSSAFETPRNAVIIRKSRSVLKKKTSFLPPRNSTWYLVNPEKAKERINAKINILENHSTSSESTKGQGKINGKIKTLKSLDSIPNVKHHDFKVHDYTTPLCWKLRWEVRILWRICLHFTLYHTFSIWRFVIRRTQVYCIREGSKWVKNGGVDVSLHNM